ncbi:glycosyltransferase family 4 protein [Ruegeria arenilitoris]|uniref:glycosyltransferase family 4 protein n=1 Tax=Ruegeria arenilitoris TaxID=1173585 RepID=UPI001C98BB23|nr:glycosyltransferase family 4 protein [Ruegeria arenilitoris]MBY6084697.1 glycosyltransferase family 4 protein [Ruegeria arenilitoris]
MEPEHGIENRNFEMTGKVAPKRIALVSSYAPSLTRFRFDLIRALIAEGHHVTAFAPENDRAVADTLADIGCDFEVLPMARTGTNPLVDAVLLMRMVRAFQRLRPDVVISYTMKPVIYGGIAARLAGVPERHALMTGLGYVFADPDPRGKRRILRDVSVRLYRAGLRGVGRAFVYNGADEDDIRRFAMLDDNSKLIRVAGTGVNLERFAHRAFPEGAPKFLVIARLLADKGVREFVAAAKRLKPEYPDAEFRILGPLDPNPKGIKPDEIEKWTEDGIVTYLGETDDVRPYLSDASVFVLPSYYREGIPRSILEAMATGRPVITTTLPGCGDTVEDGVSGFLVAPRDANALADVMRKFLDDTDLALQMGKEARARAEAVFDIHKVNSHLLTEMNLGAARHPSSTRAA